MVEIQITLIIVCLTVKFRRKEDRKKKSFKKKRSTFTQALRNDLSIKMKEERKLCITSVSSSLKAFAFLISTNKRVKSIYII